MKFQYSTLFKVSPPPAGGSQEGHNIKCAKLLTSTVIRSMNAMLYALIQWYLAESSLWSSIAVIQQNRWYCNILFQNPIYVWLAMLSLRGHPGFWNTALVYWWLALVVPLNTIRPALNEYAKPLGEYRPGTPLKSITTMSILWCCHVAGVCTCLTAWRSYGFWDGGCRCSDGYW